MILDKLKEELIQSLQYYFPQVKIDTKEKRGIIFELRAYIDEATFIEVYANTLTGKRSFALILKGERVIGYDNYRGWHYHPPDDPNNHIPCIEPYINSIFSSFKEALKKKSR